MAEQDLNLQIEATSEGAENGLEKIISIFDRMDASLAGVLSKLSTMADRMDGIASNASHSSAEKSTKSVGEAAKRSGKAAKDAGDEAAAASKKAAEYEEARLKSIDRCIEKMKEEENLSSRTGALFDPVPWDKSRVLAENAASARDVEAFAKGVSGADYKRNVSGDSNVGVMKQKGKDNAEAYARKLAAALQQATNAAAQLRLQMTQKVDSGGILSDADIRRMDAARERLDMLRLEFESVKGEGFSGIEIDESPLAGRDIDHLFDDVEDVSAVNKVIAEYGKLAEKISSVANDGGIIKESDIRKADELKARLAAIESMTPEYRSRVTGYSGMVDDAAKQSKINQTQKDYDKLSKSIEKMTARLRTLKKARETAIANGRSVAGIESRIRQVTNELERAKLQAVSLQAELDGGSVSGMLSHAAADTRKLGTSISDAAKRCVQLASRLSLIGPITNRLKGKFKSLIRLLKYRIMRTFIADALRDLKTGLQYMAKANPQFNQLMNTIVKGWYNIKAAVASALTPLISALGPSAVNVMNALANAINRVGMALAALTGQNTYTKMTANVGDFAAGLDGAAGSAKELQNQLAGFDTLHVLDDSEASGGGGGASGEVKYDTEVLDLDDKPIYAKLKRLGGEIKQFADNMKTVLRTAWDTFANNMNFDGSAIDFITDKLSGLNDYLSENGTTVGEVLGMVWTVLGDTGEILVIVAKDAIDFVAGLLGVNESESTMEKLRDILDKVHTFLKENKEEIAKFIEIALGVSLVSKLFSPLVGLIGKAVKGFGGMSGIGNAIAKLGPKVATVFKTIGSGIMSVLKFLGPEGLLIAALVALLAMLVSLIVKNWDEIVDNYKWAWEQIKAKTVEVCNAIGEFVSNMIQKVKDFFTNLKKHIADKWEEVKKTTKEKWEGIKSTVSEKIEEIKGFFGGIGEKASEAWENIKRSFKEMWEGLGQWFENTWLYKAISGLGDKLSNIKIGGSSPATSSRTIATRASGGTVNTGQLFIANERGPELIGSIGGKTAVANQSQVYSAMYDGIYQAVLRGMQQMSGASGGDINLNIELDGDKVYKSVVKRNQSKSRQTGRNPLMA